LHKLFGNATVDEQLAASVEGLSLVCRFVLTALVVTLQMKYEDDCEC
jgi:hypothetical protein